MSQFKRIPVMNTNHSNNSPVGDGERKIIAGSPPILDHKKIIEYCKPDYCLSCAYFQQVKGNFGRCTVLQHDKKFDGTKKGSACRGWRLDKHLIDIELQERINQRKDKQKTWIDEIRENYNIKTRSEYRPNKSRLITLPDEKQTPFKLYNNETRNDGLPLARTSDLTRFRAYYKHKFNKRIIDFAIKLMVENKTLSTRQISTEIQRQFNRYVSATTILYWGRKFVPERQFNLQNASHRKEIRDKISNSVSMYFKMQNIIKPMPVTEERVMVLFYDDYTLRQISKVIQDEQKTKLTYKQVFTIIQKNIKSKTTSYKPSLWNKNRYDLIIEQQTTKSENRQT